VHIIMNYILIFNYIFFIVYTLDLVFFSFFFNDSVLLFTVIAILMTRVHVRVPKRVIIVSPLPCTAAARTVLQVPLEASDGPLRQHPRRAAQGAAAAPGNPGDIRGTRETGLTSARCGCWTWEWCALAHSGMSATGRRHAGGGSGRVRGGQVQVRRPAQFRALHRRDGGQGQPCGHRHHRPAVGRAGCRRRGPLAGRR
jgi:hypothetical protein